MIAVATIIISGLDDTVKHALTEQADRNGRSLEAEARAVLAAGIERRPDNIGQALLGLFAEGQGEGINMPERMELARPMEFDS